MLRSWSGLLYALVFNLCLGACTDQDVTPPPVTAVERPEATEGSFKIRNPEIREEMLAAFTAKQVRFWINEDDSIGYFLEDGKLIDEIGNLIISEYITRQ